MIKARSINLLSGHEERPFDSQLRLMTTYIAALRINQVQYGRPECELEVQSVLIIRRIPRLLSINFHKNLYRDENNDHNTRMDHCVDFSFLIRRFQIIK